MIAWVILVIAINLFVSWRYAVQRIGPDEGIWLLWGITGARPYRDYQDCKPPGIHAWMWLLTHLTGGNIPWAKFIHHVVIGGLVVGAMVITGSPGLGVLATAMLQSSRLFAFQSWMDAMSGALLLFGMILPPILGIWFIGMAVCFNLKTAVPGAVYMALTNSWVPLAIGVGTGFLILVAYHVFFPFEFDQMIYSVFTISARMKAVRSWNIWNDFQRVSSIFVIMCISLSLWSGLSLPVFAAALSYAAFNLWGKVWRPNHYLPLAIVALSRPDPTIALIILIAEMAGSRFLIGSVWMAVFPAIALELSAAQKVGEFLRDKPGTLWVNNIYTNIYVHARKAPTSGMVEQIEIAQVAHEMTTRRDAHFRQCRPDWIVLGPGMVDYAKMGHSVQRQFGRFVILGDA